jgi:hypothetical protein
MWDRSQAPGKPLELPVTARRGEALGGAAGQDTPISAVLTDSTEAPQTEPIRTVRWAGSARFRPIPLRGLRPPPALLPYLGVHSQWPAG